MRSTLIHGGGAIFLFCIALLTLGMIPFGAPEARGAGNADLDPGRTSLGDLLAAGGICTWLIVLLGLALIVLTIVAAGAVRRENPWPHWRALVRGMGELAFLIGIFGAVTGLMLAFNTITRLGAAVTPSDLSRGIASAQVSVMFGTLVSIGSLIGVGIIRLLDGRPSA